MLPSWPCRSVDVSCIGGREHLLTLGILRPQHETDITIGDRTPSLFVADLINNYSALFPALVEKKKQEAERVMPTRKRTALVDQRISRSQLNGGSDPQQLLEQQHALAHPGKGDTPPSSASRSSVLSLGAPVAEEPEEHFETPAEEIAGMNLPKEDTMAMGKQVDRNSIPSRTATPPSFREAASSPPPTFKEPPASPPRAQSPPPTFREPASSPPPSFREPAASPPRISSPPARFQEPSRSGAATPVLDDVNSPTASILDSMMEHNPDEQPVGGGGGGLKRNTSAEVSRLRGPRGARGPRPAPGRVVSGMGSPAVAAPVEPTPETSPTTNQPQENERGGGVGVAGDYAPRKGKGATSAGAVS